MHIYIYTHMRPLAPLETTRACRPWQKCSKQSDVTNQAVTILIDVVNAVAKWKYTAFSQRTVEKNSNIQVDTKQPPGPDVGPCAGS